LTAFAWAVLHHVAARPLDISALQRFPLRGIAWVALLDIAVWGKTCEKQDREEEGK